MPDLFGYWLTGIRAAERTNASTTGLFHARTGTWAEDIMEAVGIPARLFPALRRPGDELGPVAEPVISETGLSSAVRVTMVGSHDTASAVVGVPASGERFACIACGTWSLVGVELASPILTGAGRMRTSRTKPGWTVASGTSETSWACGCSRSRSARGRTPERRRSSPISWWQPLAYPMTAPSSIPTTPSSFLRATWRGRIREACRVSDQPVPASRPALVRCILDSLAAAYARALRDATRQSGLAVDTVHLVGGGARNELLCQLTANACGLPVVAGPVEATAIGNVLIQARALGFVEGDLEALRARIRASHPLRRFEPRRAGVGSRT